MGNSSSKAAKTASKLSPANTARKYPTRPPPPGSNRTNVQPSRPSPETKLGPTVYPEVRATEKRDRGINLDSSDPDLALNARLRSLGPVQPNHTLSNTSTFNNPSHQLHSPNKQARAQPTPHSSNTNRNSSHDPSLSHSQFQASPSNPQQSIFPDARQNPAVSLLTARFRLAEEAEREFERLGKKGSEGRTFLDVVTLRRVLVLRDEKGYSDEEIEEELELKRGVVGRLGRRGVVGATGAGAWD